MDKLQKDLLAVTGRRERWVRNGAPKLKVQDCVDELEEIKTLRSKQGFICQEKGCLGGE